MTDSKLTPDFIAAQRGRLEQLRADLLGIDREATEVVRAATAESHDTPQDAGEAAQDETQAEFRQSLEDAHGPRLADIERALAKIGEGSYGQSDESDEPIPLARLEVVPEAVLTVQEAEARDQRVRATGP